MSVPDPVAEHRKGSNFRNRNICKAESPVILPLTSSSSGRNRLSELNRARLAQYLNKRAWRYCLGGVK